MKYFLCKVDSCHRKKVLLLTGAILHITDWVHYYREGYKLKNCEKLGPSPNWGERPNYNPTSPGQNNNMIKHAIKIIYTKLFLCGILKWSQLWVGVGRVVGTGFQLFHIFSICTLPLLIRRSNTFTNLSQYYI